MVQNLKRLILGFVFCLSLVTASKALDKDGLQEIFSSLLSREAGVSHSSGVGLSDSVTSQIESIVSVCNSNQRFLSNTKPHAEALMKLKNILREQTDTESFLQLAGDLRDYPQMNFHLWLTAFLSVSYERDDLVTLQKPHPLALKPEFYLPQESYNLASLQAPVSPKNRACIPVDGTLTEEDNGEEHALWYFREDLLFNFLHEFWHITHPGDAGGATIDRRGELFYYFHRSLLGRYIAERLAMGLNRLTPLVIKDGYVIEEGYFPHLAEMQAEFFWGERYHNKTTTGASVTEQSMRYITEDTQQGYLISENGSHVSIVSTQGINTLVDNLESVIEGQLNIDRYLDFGVHNYGHSLIANLSENGTLGVMQYVGTSLRDPVFYRWHQALDDIFEINKLMLPAYETAQGEFPLIWEGINVTLIEVTSVNLPSTPNVLETFMGTQIVPVPFSPDGVPINGTLEYCIKRLEHNDFQYKITTVRSNLTGAVNATVRIFMAPRFDETGRRFPLLEQRRLLFPMDSFLATRMFRTIYRYLVLFADRNHSCLTLSLVNPGETQIIRNSTQSLLSTKWKLEDDEYTPSFEVPNCGCGWPHHLLVPRGTTEGMVFDLFVMVTDSTTFDDEPEDVCVSARILCGVRGGNKYPDPLPMGYPFDRLPFVDPDTNEVVSSLEKYSQFIPNSRLSQVTIFHRG